MNHRIPTLALLLTLVLAMAMAGPAEARIGDQAPDRKAASAEPDGAGEKDAAAPSLPPGMTIYYMVFLHSCPDRPEEAPERLQQIQAGHRANIGDMAEEGILRLAGPFAPVEGSDLAGIFLLEMDSLEAAEERTAKDPAVQAGRLCPKVIPWLGPVNITHGYDEAVAKAQG